ncbi:class F sortase [Aeromicrobium sp. IC_218]|uniref:class F sortase n=1 Tax=Aeromicrobium sp. IC_218 TaxID=2545468 RepID=UPI0013F3F8D9|nr:class F sortase [Aeromicrobium sp. IC_218]
MPVRLEIPSLEVDAAVVPIVADAEGTLDPPALVKQVGWWQDGAEPGSARGSVVCAGHTVRSGGGAFNDLGDVEEGALVRVTTERGTIDYAVATVTRVPKDEFADEADELFSQESAARLVLVTCSRYRWGHYRDNTVVVAEPSPR